MLQIDFSASMTASELRSICLVHGLYSVAKKAKSRYIAAIQAFNDDIEAATEVQLPNFLYAFFK